VRDLFRELAPVSDAAWSEIEKEAKQALKDTLAARRIVDFSGPHGWSHSALNLGRTQGLRGGPAEGVDARLRQVQPLVELRAQFELSRVELETAERGAADPDLDAVRKAAVQLALAEDRAVFDGYAAGGIRGINEAATHGALAIPEDYNDYAAVVAEALDTLRRDGISGPYGIALGLRCYTGLTKTMSRGGGFPVIQNLGRILEGPIVWAPAVDGAVVLSVRGGDFEITIGQDISIGYLSHTADAVRLYLQESMTFRALSPEAAVPLVYRSSGARAAPRRRRGR